MPTWTLADMPMSRAITLALVALATLVSSCSVKQAPPAPTVRPFGDNKAWITVEDMTYVIGNTSDRIVVPRGFVTDFASIPEFLWSFGLSPHGQYSRAAVIHDFLYWSQGCTREQADRLMVIAMKESRVDAFDEFVVYKGVAGAGGGAWRSNAAERAAGLPRVIPDEFARPEDPNMDWETYRRLLQQKAVKDPPFDASPSYCRYGDSTQVPGQAP